jgi:hypothetical protein
MTDDRHPDPSDHESHDDTGETPAPESVDWEHPETWPREVGGKRGPEPTRYGDWESNGRCTDF